MSWIFCWGKMLNIMKQYFSRTTMGKTKGSSSGTGVLVLSALKKLTKNTGWTTRTITKFIKMEYRIQDPKISRKVSR